MSEKNNHCIHLPEGTVSVQMPLALSEESAARLAVFFDLLCSMKLEDARKRNAEKRDE